jgi:hypothetical protein
MTQSWGRGVVTVWVTQGAVSGYPCSQVGKTFEVELNSGKDRRLNNIRIFWLKSKGQTILDG